MSTKDELCALQLGLERMLVSSKALAYPYTSTGICYGLSRCDGCYSTAYEFVLGYSVGWRYRTGIPSKPVPDTDSKWRGAGLRLRVNLLRYLLKRIEVELCGE